MAENKENQGALGLGAALAEASMFMKSRVILSAAELDFFTALDKKPRSAAALAEDKGCDARATERLLDALAAFGLLEKTGGVYKPSGAGAFYSSRHPESILPMVLHMNHLWETWSKLTDVVKRGGDTKPEPGIHIDDERWKSFIGAMHVAGRGLSMKIADLYDASRFRRLLDIGGASGTYTIAFLRHNPNLKATLFDLENVIPMARERLAAEGLESRVELAAGNFYNDELPKGCDFALLSAIIHQHDLAENVTLYKKIHAALEPGGVLLIRDHVMDESRTKPPAGAMFAINMLVNQRGGDTFTFDEIKAGLEEAGFRNVKLVHQGEMMDGLVEAEK